MTLSFKSPQFVADNTSPATHALIIGIGEYPYLDGGAKEVDNPFGLKQLRSAPVSARAVRDWLLATGDFAGQPNAGLNNPAAPLATVEVLVADAHLPATEVAVEAPTELAFFAAFSSWLARCNANPQNVAFLYACGHGLRLQDNVFLLSDFGEPGILNQWARTISIDNLRLGMRKCNANAQFMFFDCCRNYPVAFSDPNARGRQLFDLILDRNETRSYAALYSTLDGQRAFARPEEPSYFTRALLSGLSGYGSERRDGGWFVTNKMINKALQDIMAMDVRAAPNLQIVDGESPGLAFLHFLRQEPKVRLQIDCDPNGRRQEVAFHGRRAADIFVHPGTDGIFRKDISPGEWRLEMHHLNAAFPPQPDDVLMYPPSFEKTFSIP